MRAGKWMPARTEGIWRHGPACLRPLLAAIPWITVLLLLEMLHIVSGTLVSAEGVFFGLPESSGLEDGVNASLVALVVPMPHETLVFFDDGRYAMGDDTSVRALGEHLEDRAGKTERKTLLVLADRLVPSGELMKLASLARRSGIENVLFAEKRAGRDEE